MTHVAVEPGKAIRWFDVTAISIFGVALPLITLVFELFTHICGTVYVDPVPSWWHVAGIAFVAIANGVACMQLSRERCASNWLPFLIGSSIGISVFYALVFLPLAPFAAMAIMFMGFGLLPLSPVIAFICAVRLAIGCRSARKRALLPDGAAAPYKKMGTLWLGVVAGLAFLCLAEVPNAVTDVAIRQAVFGKDEQSKKAAIRMIRTFGNEQSVLRNCYRHSASVSDMPTLIYTLSHLRWDRGPRIDEDMPVVTIDEARKIYYRAYGRPFNSVPRPVLHNSSVGNRWSEDEWELDAWSDSDIASDTVGARTAGVKLAKSDLVTTVDPDTATSYSEWNMCLENNSWAQQEARMQIQLPAGGAVSRATLWVNGKPREAAFGERNLVRQAYTSVVMSKRDPLLVTQSGPEKVMVQCFPVPPRDYNSKKPGSMQIRIGITAPCVVPDPAHAELALPRLVERSFPVSGKHHVRIESHKPFTTALKSTRDLSDATTKRVSADVEDLALRENPVVVRATRDVTITRVAAAAPLSQGKKFILAEIRQTKAAAPTKLFVLVDGSAQMAKYRDQIAQSLEKIPTNVPVEVDFASDEIAALVGKSEAPNTRNAIDALRKAPFVGGPDNGELLVQTWLKAAKAPGSAVLWIHGPQPLVHGDLNDTLSAIEASPQSNLYDAEMIAGANKLLEKLSPAIPVVEMARSNDAGSDLADFVARICAAKPAPWTVARTVSTTQPALAVNTTNPELSSQLQSLWALDETHNLLKASNVKPAVSLAAHARLVTPVTGAVVLESDADYKKYGIDPTNPDNNKQASGSAVGMPFQVGAAPEPEEYALMLVALMVIAWQARRARQIRKAA